MSTVLQRQKSCQLTSDTAQHPHMDDARAIENAETRVVHDSDHNIHNINQEYASSPEQLQDSEIHAVLNSIESIQNLSLRIYLTWFQGLVIFAAIVALLSSAYETAKVLVAVNFALGFFGITIFSLGVDLTEINRQILILLGFATLGVVAGANGSILGLYLSGLSLVALLMTMTYYIAA